MQKVWCRDLVVVPPDVRLIQGGVKYRFIPVNMDFDVALRALSI